VVMVGGDGVSYGARLSTGSWREHFLRELGDKIDLDRVHFPGRLAYSDYVRLLQRSDTHIYLTYPFVASWSLREAMACGCAIIGSDTEPVREFITHGKTGLLTPFFEPETLAENVLEQLENGAAVQRRRAAARKWAEANLRMDTYIEKYVALIEKLTGRQVHSASAPVPKSAGRKRSTK
jgi:glycosyltransferase involved in cell wall biosynthesis